MGPAALQIVDGIIHLQRAVLSAAVSLVLRLVRRDPEPAKTPKEHVFLECARGAAAWRRRRCGFATLMADVCEPPIRSGRRASSIS